MRFLRFTKVFTVAIHLKGGGKIVHDFQKFKVERSNGVIDSMNFLPDRYQVLHIDVDQIAAIQTVKIRTAIRLR